MSTVTFSFTTSALLRPRTPLHYSVQWGQNILKFSNSNLKFIYSEKATKFCEIFTLLLTGKTKDKRKVKISQNYLAFSEHMKFKRFRSSAYTIFWACGKKPINFKNASFSTVIFSFTTSANSYCLFWKFELWKKYESISKTPMPHC